MANIENQQKTAEAQLVYHPQVFDPNSLDEAKQLSAPMPDGVTEENYWEKLPYWLMANMGKISHMKKSQIILDYGCGIGRLAKQFCNEKVYIIGVDPSSKMRKYTEEYVKNHVYFTAMSPEFFTRLVESGFRVDHAYIVDTLSHCHPTIVSQTLNLVNSAIKTGGFLMVYDSKKTRSVPYKMGDKPIEWKNDSYDIWQTIENRFGLCLTLTPAIEFDPTQDKLFRTYIKAVDIKI